MNLEKYTRKTYLPLKNGSEIRYSKYDAHIVRNEDF